MKIKPLAWEEIEGVRWSAKSIVGEFIVVDGSWTCMGRMKHFLRVRDDDTAKSAALAYYESLIRTTIQEN